MSLRFSAPMSLKDVLRSGYGSQVSQKEPLYPMTLEMGFGAETSPLHTFENAGSFLVQQFVGNDTFDTTSIQIP